MEFNILNIEWVSDIRLVVVTAGKTEKFHVYHVDYYLVEKVILHSVDPNDDVYKKY